ncbi:SCP2 sterol-binding domain-containing protein [Streptomyces sp. V4-01]|uniref:SCP2 sterol-binding domain-containing protein n=1 Tax=Actinacidiphila polyblastidii TaxID=3110430 RepID=A0ABU7PK65_9ACTN|nr:SCP2 sterol-binding domain-containing protein [Streptomyces sp. V4-01]
MATVEECRTALDRFAAHLAGAEGSARDAAALDRSLDCRIADLDVTFVGRLEGGHIRDVVTVEGQPGRKAQIRLSMRSDDLVAMVAGELGFARAWATGRVRVQASLRDVLRLRSLL